jgi:threonine dehydrogenase-like Zn-dependent dehydrogenase
MGIVESVGSNVKNIKVGDRVVVSAPIACGQCECKLFEFSSRVLIDFFSLYIL